MIKKEIDNILKFEKTIQHQFIEDKQRLRDIYDDKLEQFREEINNRRINEKKNIDEEYETFQQHLQNQLDKQKEDQLKEFDRIKKNGEIQFNEAKSKLRKLLLDL